MEAKVVYDVFHLVYWDWRIAVDLFLGGLGVGAFLYAIAVMLYRKTDQLATVKVGSIIGLIAMTAGLLFMLSEMGRPLRIYKTLIRFNPTSTLSWGGLLQESFVILSAVFVFLLVTNKARHIRNGFAVFAGFFALFVACYHGFLLSFVTARPLWNAGAVNVASIIISINTGIAAVLLILSLSSRGRQEVGEMIPVLRNFLLISLLAQISTCFIWLITLMSGKADFVNAYAVLNREFGLLLWAGAITVGMIFPILLLGLYNVGAKKEYSLNTKEENHAPLLLTSALILIGGFIFRYVLVLAGQMS